MSLTAFTGKDIYFETKIFCLSLIRVTTKVLGWSKASLKKSVLLLAMFGVFIRYLDTEQSLPSISCGKESVPIIASPQVDSSCVPAHTL